MGFDLRASRAPTRTELRLRLPLLVVGVVVLTLLAGLGHLGLWAVVRHYEAELAEARQECASLAGVVERYELMQRFEATNAGKGSLIAALPVINVKWNRVLDEVRRVIPQTVVLTALRSEPSGVVTVEGRAGDLEVLAQFGAGVQTATYLGSPGLSQAQWDSATGTYVFTLSFEIREVGGGG